MAETLKDERCGLFFLAGADAGASGPRTVTVHAAEGALTTSHRGYIEDTFAKLYPEHDVKLRFHSKADLHTPDSLESFARRFQHDAIIADPTGAFARVSKLLELAGLVREELGGAVDRLLWQADASALVVVAAKAAGDPSLNTDAQRIERMTDDVKRLVEMRACGDLKKAIRSVRVTRDAPSGRYTPVDAQSRVVPVMAPVKRSLPAILARVSGLAALIGLGTLSAASAATPAVIDESQAQMPGITGLIGLTTLGENSYGLRNRYQAVGGLRLYFGETGLLMVSALNPGAELPERAPATSGTEIEHSAPVFPKPSRVAYGD